MESNEIHVLPRPMSRDLEEIVYALETAGACELRGDVVDRNRHDRVNFDLAFFHDVPLACRYARPMPNANTAGDRTRSDAVAQILYEQHATSLERSRGNAVTSRDKVAASGDKPLCMARQGRCLA